MAEPSRRNSGLDTTATWPWSMRSRSQRPEPMGTVLFVTTIIGPVRASAMAAAAAATYVVSGLPSARAGVPTQRKVISAPSSASW